MKRAIFVALALAFLILIGATFINYCRDIYLIDVCEGAVTVARWLGFNSGP